MSGHMPGPILVTGGLGYIGSHVVLELLRDGAEVVIIDNLVNSSPDALGRIEEVAGRKATFYNVDLVDPVALRSVFEKHAFYAVVHLAALKAVGESVAKPLLYYHNNVTGGINLMRAMDAAGVKRLVFSSSATVYGTPQELPIPETHPLSCTNPYGETKFMQETIMRDLCASDPTWHVVSLRYFNPIGADPSGRIGEDPRGVPNNVMPFMMKVAVGKLPELSVFGSDYDTPDGTGVRDYIHVTDLARGHVSALRKLVEGTHFAPYNLGTGNGVSVLELLAAVERAVGKKIPHTMKPRRPGDIAACYADSRKAENELAWKATKTLDEMCQDAWRWQSGNPDGYTAK